MRNVTVNKASAETRPNLELSLDELETVSAGKGKSGGSTSQARFLEFKLKEVFITSYSI